MTFCPWGFKGINLAVSYHAGKFIHPRSIRHRVYFPEDGVIYFRPRATYKRIKPVLSGLLEQGDVLEYLGGTEGLLLNAWDGPPAQYPAGHAIPGGNCHKTRLW